MTDALQKRVVWWTGDEDLPVDERRAPLIAIIGREHYQEAVESVPAASWFQLRLAVKLRLISDGFHLFFIGPVEDGRRSVRSYRLASTVPIAVSKAWFWLPETLALDYSLDVSRVFDVSRCGSRYFLVPKNGSQLHGAMLSSTETFLLASGIAHRETEKILDKDVLRGVLRGISKIPLVAWFDLVSPSKARGLTSELRPLATAFAIVFCAYMAGSTAYLVALNSIRDSQIGQLDGRVAGLLEMQRESERMGKDYQLLYRLANDRTVTYIAWNYVKPIWDVGGIFSGLSVQPGSVIVRGSAASATEVLEKIASMKSVKAAKFDSPVRDDMGRQSFSIMVVPQDSDKSDAS